MNSPPPPPPEAVLLRLVREAAGLKIPVAAKKAGISVARWSQIELGYETRRGRIRAVRARPGTLAHMAYAAGLSPDRLEHEGQRPDAAAILREILREQPAEPVDSLPLDLSGLPPDVVEAIGRVRDPALREAFASMARVVEQARSPQNGKQSA